MSNNPTAPAEKLLARLQEGDHTAWPKLVACLIGAAMGHIRLALSGDTTGHPRRLVWAVGEDSQEAQAALYSALDSLKRRLDGGEYPGVTSAEDLAVDLIRLAVNRYQRRDRGNERIRGEVGRGATLATAETPQPSPAEDATRKEICEHLATEAEELLSTLKDQHRAIIRAKLENPDRLGCEIAEVVGTSDATVSRVWQRFQDKLRGRLEHLK
jgi:DNA-directed RNA polymerase specialized sigma24 family protein